MRLSRSALWLANSIALLANAPAFALGMLENPTHGGNVSGIGVISGWVCQANRVTVRIDGGSEIAVPYGSPRGDTAAICGGATNTGFALLHNWNLAPGSRRIEAFADGVAFGSATVIATSFGAEFLRGAGGTYELANFPTSGRVAIVAWDEALQNFVVAAVREPGADRPAYGTWAVEGVCFNVDGQGANLSVQGSVCRDNLGFASALAVDLPNACGAPQAAIVATRSDVPIVAGGFAFQSGSIAVDGRFMAPDRAMLSIRVSSSCTVTVIARPAY